MSGCHKQPFTYLQDLGLKTDTKPGKVIRLTKEQRLP